MERVEDLLLRGGDEAGAVGVFDAEDELAGPLAGVEEVQQANVGGADVGVSGGRGGDADAGGFGGFGHDWSGLNGSSVGGGMRRWSGGCDE